jgi:hypothetical protein
MLARSRRQLVQQDLRLFQIERVEAFGEPAVHRNKQIAGFIAPALITPESRHAYRRAQFPGSCLLLTSYGKSPVEIRLRFRCMLLGWLERKLARKAVGLGFEPFRGGAETVSAGALPFIHEFRFLAFLGSWGPCVRALFSDKISAK